MATSTLSTVRTRAQGSVVLTLVGMSSNCRLAYMQSASSQDSTLVGMGWGQESAFYSSILEDAVHPRGSVGAASVTGVRQLQESFSANQRSRLLSVLWLGV